MSLANKKHTGASKKGQLAGQKKGQPEKQLLAKNRTAHYEYEILETFEAGLELFGTEVRSLRERSAQITEAFVLIRKGEAWLHGVHIAPFSHGSYANKNPDRTRRLLLHRKQIQYLEKKTEPKGMAIVPLELYFDKHGRVKVKIALAKGKKLYDKRASEAKRESDRRLVRELKERNNAAR